MDPDTPLPVPRLVHLWFAQGRKEFAYPEETYRDWSLIAARAGRFRYALGNARPEVCHTGECVFCPPGVTFRRETLSELSFCFTRFRWAPCSPERWQGKWSPEDVPRANSTYSHLKKIFGAPERNGANAWANHLLGDLLNQFAYESQNKGSSPAADPDRLMLKMADHLRLHVAESIPLQELARSFRISPFQLSRRFRSTFGISPSDYRLELRIQLARKLLLETDWTVDRVGEACGFENGFYFSRVFKKHERQPPGSFRNLNRI